MTEKTQAAEHLRVIRTLMERATVYRAISAPTALVGGLLSVAVAGWSLYRPRPLPFIPCWLVVLGITILVNTFFVWREAGRDGRPLFSSGMRLALRSMLPSIVAAAVFSLPFFRGKGPLPLHATLWVIFYGLALLSMEHFSPRSLVWLGRIFLFTGLVAFMAVTNPLFPVASKIHAAHLVMGVTFGFFHVIYAAFTWPGKRIVAAE